MDADYQIAIKLVANQHFVTNFVIHEYCYREGTGHLDRDRVRFSSKDLLTPDHRTFGAQLHGACHVHLVLCLNYHMVISATMVDQYDCRKHQHIEHIPAHFVTVTASFMADNFQS